MFLSGLKIQKESILESRKQTREQTEVQRQGHEKDMKELEKVKLYLSLSKVQTMITL